MELSHNGGHIAAIVITAVMFAVALGFNYLSSSPAGKTSGMYVSTISEISNKFFLQITPAGWTFTIWAFIYLWQAAWVIYGFTSIFRKCPDGYLYLHPPIIPLPVYIVYIFNLCINIGWVFLFDRSWIVPSLIFIVLIPLTLIACLVLSYRRFHETTRSLMSHGNVADVWLIRILFHNGLAFYCGWVSVAALLNTGFILVYILNVANDVASTVALSILCVLLITYFALDIFLLDKWTRYQFSNYIPVIMALGGSIAKNYVRNGPTSANSILTVILLAMALAAFFIKMVMLIVRHCRDPMFNESLTTSYDLHPITKDGEQPEFKAVEHNNGIPLA